MSVEGQDEAMRIAFHGLRAECLASKLEPPRRGTFEAGYRAALVESEARERELGADRDKARIRAAEYEAREGAHLAEIKKAKAREAVLVEARDKALSIAANTNGTDRGMHEALGEIETVLRAGVVEAEPDEGAKC